MAPKQAKAAAPEDPTLVEHQRLQDAAFDLGVSGAFRECSGYSSSLHCPSHPAFAASCGTPFPQVLSRTRRLCTQPLPPTKGAFVVDWRLHCAPAAPCRRQPAMQRQPWPQLAGALPPLTRPPAHPTNRGPAAVMQRAGGKDIVKRSSTRKGRYLLAFNFQLAPAAAGKLVRLNRGRFGAECDAGSAAVWVFVLLRPPPLGGWRD